MRIDGSMGYAYYAGVVYSKEEKKKKEIEDRAEETVSGVVVSYENKNDEQLKIYNKRGQYTNSFIENANEMAASLKKIGYTSTEVSQEQEEVLTNALYSASKQDFNKTVNSANRIHADITANWDKYFGSGANKTNSQTTVEMKKIV